MPPANAVLDTGTKLAVERTWLAHERTMMAWVRTATSLISFGFAIYKFFQLELGNRGPAAEHPTGPREFALLMIGIGLAALILGFVEHRHSTRTLRATYGDIMPTSVAGLVAGLVSLLGIVAILAVVFRQ